MLQKMHALIAFSLISCGSLGLSLCAIQSRGAEMPGALAIMPFPINSSPIRKPSATVSPTNIAPDTAPGPPAAPVNDNLIPNSTVPSPDVSSLSRYEIKGRVERTVSIEDNWLELYEKGQALYREGKYSDAYSQWKVSLAIANKNMVWTRVTGVEQIEILKKIAMMHKTQSEPSQAIEKYDIAIRSAVKSNGADSLTVANLMLEQGRMYTFYEQVKSPTKANEFLNEAFRINEKLYGRFAIPTGDVAMVIAQLKEKEKNFSEALSEWQLVIDIGDRLEPNDISCCRIGPRQGKIRCLESLGKFDEAIIAHRDLIAMCKAGAPTMMPTVLNAYASCLLKTGRENESKEISKEAFDFKK